MPEAIFISWSSNVAREGPEFAVETWTLRLSFA
jgi:hypothetical protein